MSKLIRILNAFLRLITRKHLNPTLPETLFLVGTYFFPQINIELIIRINSYNILYIWRDDAFGNHGWHLPGSIIRPNERILTRLAKLISTEVHFLDDQGYTSLQYLGCSEVFSEHAPCIRSHFLSHIYLVDYVLPSDVISNLETKYLLTSVLPDRIIDNHLRYSTLMKQCMSGATNIIARVY